MLRNVLEFSNTVNTVNTVKTVRRFEDNPFISVTDEGVLPETFDCL